MQMNLPRFSTKLDKLSLSSCYVDLLGVGEKKPHATGFFWRSGKKVYFVTNWHVVTGKNIFTGEHLANGWCPEELHIHFLTETPPSYPISVTHGIPNKEFDVQSTKVLLYRDFHEPLWLQHKRTFDFNIDIIVLELEETERSAHPNIVCVNDFRFESLFNMVGSEIFIVGHPLGRHTTTYPFSFPVWKRGSIASELIVPWNMKPAFLVDTRTSEGMSGSPVVRRTYGPAVKADLSMTLDSVVCTEFMGVYSGRLHDDENNASIGLVWHRNLIDEIITSPSPGSRDWRKPPADLAHPFGSVKS